MTLIPLKGADGNSAPAVLVSTNSPAAFYENYVNGQQSVAEADNGNYAVAWTDQNDYVYTRLFQRDGTPLTSPTFLGMTDWSITVPDGTGHGTGSARVAMNHQGDFVVTWTKLYGPGDVDIMAQVFNADGTSRGPVLGVATSTDVEYEPSVAIDGSGDFVVAYTDWDHNTFQVHAVLFTADGWHHAVPVDPGPPTIYSQMNHQPSVAMNDSGAFVVAYTRDLFFGTTLWGQSVVARRYDATGTPLGSLFYVDGTPGHELQPSVAINDSGAFVVAYTQDNNPTRSVPDEFAAMNEITPGDGYGYIGPVYTYTGMYYSGSDVMVVRYGADGQSLGQAPVAITSANEYDPSVAIGNDGRFTVAYTSGGGYKPGQMDSNLETAKLRTFDTLGQPSPGEIPVTLTPMVARAEGNYSPSVAMNESGEVVATYNHWGPTPGGITGFHAFAQAFQTNPYRIVPHWGDINATTGILLTNGQSFALPVTVYRDPGYTGDVTLTALGLPAGVTATMSAPDPTCPLVETRTLTFTAAVNLAGDATAVARVASYGADSIGPDVTIPIKVTVTAGRIDGVTTPPAPTGTLLRGGWGSIYGAGLLPGSQVFFGDSKTPAQTGLVYPDNTGFDVLVPADATDGLVKVVTPYGCVLFSPISYTISEGTIDSLNVTEGHAPQSLQQGTEVILYGSNFKMDDLIQFGGNPNTQVAGLQARPFLVSSDRTMAHVYVPRDALTGVITDFKPSGAHISSAQTFTVDSYRDTNGFNFINFNYGVRIGCINELFDPSLFGEPSAYALLAAVSGAGDNGACYGMALASLRFQQHTSWIDANHGLPDGRPPTVNNLAKIGPLVSFIEAEHIAQFSQEGRDAKSAWRGQHRDNAPSVYDGLYAMLAAGDHPMISMHNTDGEGHCVVAYDLSGDRVNGFTIYVYDPNRQYDNNEANSPTLHVQNEQDSVIHVSPDNTWSFLLGDSPAVIWSNDLNNLTAISASSIPDTPTMPDTLDGLMDDLVNAGGVAPVAGPDVIPTPTPASTSHSVTTPKGADQVVVRIGTPAQPKDSTDQTVWRSTAVASLPEGPQSLLAKLRKQHDRVRLIPSLD
jgi:hypothetical protein